ncbi:MAG TPA: urease accessory protein UreD [Candidatus Binatia bacterium]|nr:urease accessory protein UreD [Candidatus Binatia bacterium]
MQRPFYPEADGVCHTYVLHPPAGIVGGDDLSVGAAVDEGAHALVTTPAATRWYFSRGREARVVQHVRVAAGATLEWLPQETLLFDGTHARLTTRVDVTTSGRFCGWEILGFGRPACGERLDSGRVDFRFDIYRDEQPRLRERLCGAARPPGLRGHAACAMLVATPADAAALGRVREVLAAASGMLCAATLIEDMLIVRGLTANCEPLKVLFSDVWSAVRPIVLGRRAVPPRIWQT